jgi:exopolysaccharide biosynthesis polyprenyl glycosylphosphotransferase
VVAEGWATAAEHAQVQVQAEYIDSAVIEEVQAYRAPRLVLVDASRSFLTGESGLLVASKFELMLKRLIDIAGSVLLMVLLFPVLILTAFAVKVTSKGPILFTQFRVGKDGRRFKVLKFRSMSVTAEEDRLALEDHNEAAGPVFKIQEDPRITPIGKFIRKLSFDELPQFWNVFRGEMSLVGPRPPLPQEVDEYTYWERQRLMVKPGITGIWQVSGRSDLDFETWISMDIQYIEEWTPRLDFVLLFKTIPAVVSGKGAY